MNPALAVGLTCSRPKQSRASPSCLCEADLLTAHNITAFKREAQSVAPRCCKDCLSFAVNGRRFQFRSGYMILTADV